LEVNLFFIALSEIVFRPRLSPVLVRYHFLFVLQATAVAKGNTSDVQGKKSGGKKRPNDKDKETITQKKDDTMRTRQATPASRACAGDHPAL
jgi:hypothetical protein